MTEIVAVTFTEKAAGELKLRLRERLEQDRAGRGRTTRCGSGSRTRSRRSRKRTSTRFTASAPSCCASGRSKRASIRCSPCSPSRRPTGCTTARSARWLQEALQDPPEGVRRALRRTSAPSFGGGDSDGPSIGCAAPAARSPSGAISRSRGSGRRSIAVAEIDRLVASASSTRRSDRARRRPSATTCSSTPTPSAGSAGRFSSSSRSASAISTAGKRGWSISCAIAGFSRTRKGSGYKYGKDVERATEVLAARDALFAGSAAIQAGDADADLAACTAAGARRRDGTLSGAEAAAGALDFADLLARDPRSDQNQRRGAPPSAAEVRADLRRRVPGHRSGAGRDPAAAGGRRSRDSTIRERPSASRQALHRRRSEAGDLPVPRHRRRHLLARQPSARSARRTRAAADDELSQRAGDPAVRQRGVRHGDVSERRWRCRPTTCRCRRIATADESQPAIVALPVPGTVRRGAVR